MIEIVVTRVAEGLTKGLCGSYWKWYLEWKVDTIHNISKRRKPTAPSKVKFSRYGPGVAQSVGGDIALFFHDCGTRRGWVVSSTPWPHFTPGKDPVPIVQETGWAPGPVWTRGKSRPHRDSTPDLQARSQSLYLAHTTPCLDENWKLFRHY